MAQSKNQPRPHAGGQMNRVTSKAENAAHGSRLENAADRSKAEALEYNSRLENGVHPHNNSAANASVQEPFLTQLNHNGNNSHVRGRVANNNPNPVDVHVGRRMRLRRTMLSYSQQFVARQLGLTFQQVQKYEKGANRIGASRLWDISKVLQVSMDFFFEDMDEETQKQSPMELCAPDSGLPIKELAEDPLSKKETLQLVNAYYKIHNRKLAQSILEVITMMSKSNSTMQDK